MDDGWRIGGDWLMEDGISDGVVPVVEEEGSERYFEGEEIKNMHAYL